MYDTALVYMPRARGRLRRAAHVTANGERFRNSERKKERDREKEMSFGLCEREISSSSFTANNFVYYVNLELQFVAKFSEINLSTVLTRAKYDIAIKTFMFYIIYLCNYIKYNYLLLMLSFRK